MILAALALAGGVALLTLCAERAVTAAERISEHLGISPVIVGALVVGLGTSLPAGRGPDRCAADGQRSGRHRAGVRGLRGLHRAVDRGGGHQPPRAGDHRCQRPARLARSRVIGNVLGSNLFNGLAVAGLAGLVGTGPIEESVTPSLLVLLGISGFVVVWGVVRHTFNRGVGLVLLAAYAVVIAVGL